MDNFAVSRLMPLNPVKIILFGSYAHGNPNENSVCGYPWSYFTYNSPASYVQIVSYNSLYRNSPACQAGNSSCSLQLAAYSFQLVASQ